MYCPCSLFNGLTIFFWARGIYSYRPIPDVITYPPNTSWLSSSEENKVYFKELEDAVHKYTLPGTVADVLANHTILDDEGIEERMNYVKEFIKNRNKKYFNNQTGRFETYHQRMAKVHADMMDEMFEKENKDKEFRNEKYINDDLVARFLAHHPNVSFIPEMHAVTDYDYEYSGDRIKDDYEIKRRKRAVAETETHVSKNQNEVELSSEKIKSMVKNGDCKYESVGSLNDNIFLNKNFVKEKVNHDRASEDFLRTGMAKEEKKIARKYKIKNRRKRSIGDCYLTSNEDSLKSLKYLVLKKELGEINHVVKRAVADDSTPPRQKELYKDYKSDWPYSKYDSNLHNDYFVPLLKRKKNSSDYKKRHTPESSIINSFYNDGHYNLDKETEKKKNLLRSMEYWTFTDPFAKYTSTSTKKYDKPYPTFGRNAATISVGASRFKLFNRNWYNEYKHRVHKRDVFSSNSSAVKLVHKVGHYLWKVGTVYETIMNFYFTSVHRYLRKLYYQSYLSQNQDAAQFEEDSDYVEAAQRMAHLALDVPTINPNLTFTILSQATETQTQYVVLNWYTEKYKNNSTQYFCDYVNDTYILVNNTLKLYNKTIHQLVPKGNNNENGLSETDYTMFDMNTMEPPKLNWISSSEIKKLHLNFSASDNDKYIFVKNMSNPFDTYQESLNDILGRKKVVYESNSTECTTLSLQENKEDTMSNLTQMNSGGDLTNISTIFKNMLSGAPTDYPSDFFDKAADLVLSFFIKNESYLNSLNKETTTADDYTEITNDLFDKIEDAAIRLYKVSTNITSSVEATSEVTSLDQNTINENVLFNMTQTTPFQQNDSIPTTSFVDLSTNRSKQNKSEEKLATVNELKVYSNYSITKIKKLPNINKPILNNDLGGRANNILEIGKRKIRSRRSLVSRCLKGIKFVGHIFRPMEKGIVNVLDDIFGPYSSSHIKSDHDDEARGQFNPLTVVVTHSKENMPDNHIHNILSLSSKEEKSRDQENSISKKTPKAENSLSEKLVNDSPKSKEDNSDIKELRKNSKRKKKHRRKHKHLNDPFDDTITVRSDIPLQSEERINDQKTDDQTLPSFIKNPKFGEKDSLELNNTPNREDPIKDSKNQGKSPVSNQPFDGQMSNSKIPDYNDAHDLYGRNQPFGNQMENNTFQDYDQQNPYGRNQPFGNQMGKNTFQDYDQQNPYGRNQPFGKQMGNNTFPDYDQQNPYGRNQPFGNQMGNNTFQDYDQQNPYEGNQPFGNQMENNTFQDYDQQNPYGRNQLFGNQIGNNTFQDYDQQNPYAINQPFGNQMGNNTFQNYDQQNPYGRNQPFGNQMRNNTFQDYGQQNPHRKIQPFGYQMGNNTFQDYDQQNPYGRNQAFESQMGNNTFQDYDQQNLYGRNQLLGNQMGNNTFQDYNDPYMKSRSNKNQFPTDYNEQPNPYMKSGFANDTLPDLNNQQGPNNVEDQFTGNNFYNETFPSNLPDMQYNQANGLDPYNNYGDVTNPQINEKNGFLTNTNSLAQDSNYMSTLPNLAPNQALNGVNQKDNNFGNNPQQVKTQGNLPSNNLQMNSRNQNLLGGHQQVNVTNSYISSLSQLLLQSETAVGSTNMDVGTKKFIDNSIQTNSTITKTKVPQNDLLTSKTMLSPSVLNITTVLSMNDTNSLVDLIPGIIVTISTSTENPDPVVLQEAENITIKANSEFLIKTTPTIFLHNDSKLSSVALSSLFLTSVNKNITFNIDDWFNNDNDTNIFENIFSKPDMIINITEKYAVVENDKNTSVKSIFPNLTSSLEEISTKAIVQTSTLNDLKVVSPSKVENMSYGNLPLNKTSNTSQVVIDKLELKDLLKSIYISNTSSNSLKTALDRFLEIAGGEEIISTGSSTTITVISSPSTFTFNQNLPDILTMNFSGSPYVLLKQDLLKANPSPPNNLNIDNNVPINPSVQEPPVFNPFQNLINLPPNYKNNPINPFVQEPSMFNPFQNLINLPSNLLNPYPNNPLIVSNNIQGQDYPFPVANTFQEFSFSNFSIGPYRQVYPNFAQPPYHLMGPPGPPNIVLP